jgi:hypothetical protein
VIDIGDRDDESRVIDAVDDSVRAATRAEPILQRRKQPLSDPVWVPEQRSSDELKRSSRHRLGQCLASAGRTVGVVRNANR